uniref:Uncharacterized protein n=1 Tax=Oncorhynchus mykiss TaxID=8022 RepID=A0A8C7SP08_ONCMY
MTCSSHALQKFPPPTEEGKANVSVKLKPEVFNPFTLSPLPEQTILDVLVDWVQNKRLFSPTAARGMVITDVTHEVAYCYRLETFTEHRSVCLRFEPQCKTSKATMSPKPAGEVQEPQPWKVPVTPAKMFHNQVLNYRLIHTDRVTGCSYCQEQKCVMCKACCASTRCKGEKMVPCMSLGQVCCEMCVGKGQMFYFKELQVDYRCHLDRYLLGVPGSIPEERISHAKGEILHNGLGQKVCPISTFSVEEVNAASWRMVRSSHSSCPQCRIIQQTSTEGSAKRRIRLWL